MVAGAIPLVLQSQCELDCRAAAGAAIAIFCGGVLVLLGGFLTAVSAVLRVERTTYFIVTCTVLSAAAVGLSWLLLSYDRLV